MDQLQPAGIEPLTDAYSEKWNDTSFAYDFKENTSMARPTMSPDMLFTHHSLTIVIIYCICFFIAAIGNLTVFLTLSRGRYRKSRISLMICHLSIADLLVAFFTIPIEIGWRLTVQWVAGNAACKILSFLRAFGLYLSNNILICVSLDRYSAVLHPLRVTDAHKRVRTMLICAWAVSTLYAVPQFVVFSVRNHPQHPNYTQCVTFGTFSSPAWENSYIIFCMMTLYFIPLSIICYVYVKILCEISSKSRENNQALKKSSSSGTLESSNSNQGSRMRLRRSDMSSIERARSRTLKMTIKIVVAFILCWTPYIIMNVWFVIDKDSVLKVNEMVQQSLILMAVANSCVNPLVYGSYAIDLKKECCRCFLPCIPKKTDGEVTLIHRSIVGSGQTKSSAVCGKIQLTASPRLSCSTTSKEVCVEKLPLRTIRPILKDPSIKSPCSESAAEQHQQTQLSNECSEFLGIVERQSA